MSKIKKTITIFIAVYSLVFMKPVLAQYNSDKLGEAIGGYLIINDLFEKFSASECGYVVRKEYTLNHAVNETIPYLNNQDQREFNSFLKSKKFKSSLYENEMFIKEFLIAGKKDGLDQNTLCGIMASNISMTYKVAKEKWEYAKIHYSK